MKTILSLLLLFVCFLKAEIVFDDSLPPSTEHIIDYDTVQNDDTEPVSQDELRKNSQEVLDDVVSKHHNQSYTAFSDQNLYLSIQKQPKKAIFFQRVAVDIKATVTREDLDRFETTFTKSSAVKLLNPKQKWQKIDQNSYKIRYFLQFLKQTNQLGFSVTAFFKNGSKSRSFIKLDKIKLVGLKADEYFSHVIADKLQVKSHTQKIYDDKHNIVLVEIVADNSNLKDFHIDSSIKSGVDEFKDKNNTQTAFAYAIVDKKLQRFKFKYFNSKKNRYELVDFDIILKDQTLSTQTDLNPQRNSFKMYKTVALLSVAFVLFLFFLKTRSKLTGAMAIFFILWGAYINFPLKTVDLKKGDGLKILPTQNSTVFYIVPSKLEATVIYETKDYYKVMIDNNHIGWIKKDDK